MIFSCEGVDHLKRNCQENADRKRSDSICAHVELDPDDLIVFRVAGESVAVATENFTRQTTKMERGRGI